MATLVAVVQFVASTVLVDTSDEEFILVGFADEGDGESRETLHFQRSYEFDVQDVALGLDQVYVERNGQSLSAYGGIERVELYPHLIRVLLRGRTADQFAADTIEIALVLPPEEFDRLRNGLRTVFQGFGSMVEHAG